MSVLTSASKAAQLSGIPYRILLALLRDGKIPSVELPGRRTAMVDLVDIEEFIQGAKTDRRGVDSQTRSGNVFPMAPQPSFSRTRQAQLDVGPLECVNQYRAK
jgi:hypothetical protein